MVPVDQIRGLIADTMGQLISSSHRIEIRISAVARENPLVDWLLAMLQELPEENAPITYWLIGIITGVFIVEVVMTHFYELHRIQVFSTGMFGVYPTVAWALSPFLHRGGLHWIASVVGLAFLVVAIERHWTRWRYI